MQGYRTGLGFMAESLAEDFLESEDSRPLHGHVQLIMTSPPFPLNRKKRYGNMTGQEYVTWLSGFALKLRRLLTPTGSIVIELGNAWEQGSPTMSTLSLEAMIEFKKAGDYFLCQQFICDNKARLPSPAQWVNIERIRVKDSYTNVWWMSATARPKADNRKVLTKYSSAMLELLERGSYNSGRRESGHNIGATSFLRDHGGAIPSNVLTISNTASGGAYRQYCARNGIPVHPAKMQPQLVEFFVKYLTDSDDLVFDPFGGSNTTGAVAERLGRRWVACEPLHDYVEGSRGRFSETVPLECATGGPDAGPAEAAALE